MAEYSNDGKHKITCQTCGKKVNARYKHQKYCSSECYNQAFAKKYGRYGRKTATNNKYHSGLLSEVGVTKILLEHDIEVFRALCFGQFCDLVLFKAGKLYVADVKTGYKQQSGRVTCPKRKESLQHQYTQIYLVYLQHEEKLYVYDKNGKETSLKSL